MVVPAAPYRGIHPFRFVDRAIFFARDEETRLLASLVAVYRGVFLYGDSGSGKSSLINAGLLPQARRMGFAPVRVRLQPRPGEELVLEPIVVSDDGAELLPSVLAPDHEGSSRVVLSIAEFEARLRAASDGNRPLLVFDQFEEILTLFDDAGATASRIAVAAMIVRLLREPLPVKLVLAFREDYLGKVKQLLAACPELVDQSLRLGPPSAAALETIIRGPFDRFPDEYRGALDRALAQHLGTALAERFGTGEVSLSEVQTVCLRLWRSPDPEALLAEKGVQGLLEEELGEALDRFPPAVRAAAVALLSQMVTSAGTRNVVSAEDLRQRVREEDMDIGPALLDEALDRLERESKLVRRERRRDLYLYEITSEFLVPWISRRREELRHLQERRRERLLLRQRLRGIGTLVGVALLALLAGLVVWALDQGGQARQEERRATSLALAFSASQLLGSRPDTSLLLGLAAYTTAARVEAQSAALAALTLGRGPAVPVILRGHRGPVRTVAFSPDGHQLGSGGADGTVRLWDVGTHRPVGAPLTGHVGPVLSLAFSPDRRLLASAGVDGKVRLWNAVTRTPVGRPLTGGRGAVFGVAFSPGGRLLAYGGADGTIRIRAVSTGRPRGPPLTGHRGPVFGVAFSPDGHMLASASADRTVRLWDVATHRELGPALTGHGSGARSVAFGPDGRVLASAGFDGSIRLWDVRTHQPLGQPLIGHRGAVYDVAFSADGRILASAGFDGTTRLWDVRSRRPLGQPLAAHEGPVYGVALSLDGRTLASAGRDATILLADVRSRDPLGQPLTGHVGRVYGLAFSPDGRVLASAGGDRTVRVWDLATRRPRGDPLTGYGGPIHAIAFSPSGHLIAYAGGTSSPLPGFPQDETAIRLWDLGAHRQLGAPLAGHTRSVRSVAFSPDGRMLASASFDRTIRLWDVGTQRELGRPLVGHTSGVTSVAFSGDGRLLASASNDQTVRLWDVRTRRQVGSTLAGHTDAVLSVAFDPSAPVLASAGVDTTIRLWDLRTHKPLGQPLTGHTGAVDGVAFSPDGLLIASAGIDGTTRLWDLGTRRQLGVPLTVHRGDGPGILVLPVLPDASLAFSPDGRSLASSNGRDGLRLWERILWRTPAELRATVCELVGSGLSRAEWTRYAGGIPFRPTCP